MAEAEVTGPLTKTKHYQPPITERPKVVLPPPRNVSPFIRVTFLCNQTLSSSDSFEMSTWKIFGVIENRGHFKTCLFYAL